MSTRILPAVAVAALACTMPNPAFDEPTIETSDGGTSELGTLWCARAGSDDNPAVVSFNGQAVPPEFGGPQIRDQEGEWMIGCECIDRLMSESIRKFDEDDDGVLVFPDGSLAELRDNIHFRAESNCQVRAFELAESFFCSNFCGAPYFFEFTDFDHFTEENCFDVVQPTTEIYTLDDDSAYSDCAVGAYNPLPGS